MIKYTWAFSGIGVCLVGSVFLALLCACVFARAWRYIVRCFVYVLGSWDLWGPDPEHDCSLARIRIGMYYAILYLTFCMAGGFGRRFYIKVLAFMKHPWPNSFDAYIDLDAFPVPISSLYVFCLYDIWFNCQLGREVSRLIFGIHSFLNLRSDLGPRL